MHTARRSPIQKKATGACTRQRRRGAHEPTEAGTRRSRRPAAVVGIGETGLDYYRFNGRSPGRQRSATGPLRVAHHRGGPAHRPAPWWCTPAARPPTRWDVLRAAGAGAVRGVFHCFTETREVAMACADLGFTSPSPASSASAMRRTCATLVCRAAERCLIGDRQPLPGAGASPRQAEPAGLGEPRGGSSG